MLVSVGLSHKTAPIAVRERIAIAPGETGEFIKLLLSEASINEAFVLSTCNRVEIYVSTARDTTKDLQSIAPNIAAILVKHGDRSILPHLVYRYDKEVVLHLFRVASSLDSLVLGEPQILGQLKTAIDAAREANALGTVLGRALHQAIRIGKRVRSETKLGHGQVSVSSVAVDLARQIFGELAQRTVLLVGAGEMAEAAAKLLVRAGAHFLVCNRSVPRASQLAQENGGEVRDFADLEFAIRESDIVISSTASPRYVITPPMLRSVQKARRGRSLFFIDIAVPRDIDPMVSEFENVYVYNIDDLSQIVSESIQDRAREGERAEQIVLQEAQRFEIATLERTLGPTIVGLRARTHAILHAELERTMFGRLKHLSEEDRQALNRMMEAATNKLLHEPTTHLRKMADHPRCQDYMEMLHDLFRLPDVHGLTEDHDQGEETNEIETRH